MFSLIIIHSLCFNDVISQKMISMKTEMKEQRHSIILNFIDFSIKVYAILNTYIDVSHFIIINNDKFITKNDFHPLALFDDYNASRYTTDIKFGDYYLSNVNLYITTHSIKYNSDVGLSLSFKDNPNEISFIDKLYQDKIIARRIFGFHRENTKEGQLFLGGIDKNILSESKNSTYLNVEKGKHWKVAINNIQYESKKKEINLSCIIHSGLNELIISDKLYKEIKETVMHLPMSNGDCIERKEVTNTTRLICLSSGYLFSKNEYLEITISNILFRIRVSQLFQYDTNNSMYVESKFVTNDYDNQCYLGSSFLNLFDYSLFDYDNKQIQLFSSNEDVQIITHSSHRILFLLIILICLLLISIIYLLYRITKYKE